MSSELEVLKQRIIELEAENAEIPDLRRKISEFDAERAELKHRIVEVLRMTEKERTRCNAENAKLKARIKELEKNNTKKNAEFRDHVTKVEQRQMLDDNTPNDNTPNDNTPNNNSSNFNSGVVHHEKSSQEKEMDIFLDGVDKKIVGEEIRRRNKEKKLQRESANQDITPEPAYVAETNNDDNLDEPRDRSISEKLELFSIL